MLAVDFSPRMLAQNPPSPSDGSLGDTSRSEMMRHYATLLSSNSDRGLKPPANMNRPHRAKDIHSPRFTSYFLLFPRHTLLSRLR